MIVRRATPADAARLSAFAERVFRETFADTNTPEDLALYCASAFGPEIQLREIVDPAVTTLLVETDEQLTAYAQLWDAPAHASVAGAAPVELKRFYVSPQRHGTGLARTLMVRTLEAAAGGAHDVVWLGVWERNPRAIRFYQKEGFTIVGDHMFLLGTDAQRDLIMARGVAGNRR